jgi:hypothetical protein
MGTFCGNALQGRICKGNGKNENLMLSQRRSRDCGCLQRSRQRWKGTGFASFRNAFFSTIEGARRALSLRIIGESSRGSKKWEGRCDLAWDFFSSGWLFGWALLANGKH